MLDQVTGATRARVVALLEQTLAPAAPARPIEPDTAFSDIGLTSFDIVNLMLLVESEFDISIPQAEIVPENFRSVASVEGLLARLGLRVA
jgi:acyl carrier protein